jgi:epsilon-lactone hydrolase
MVSPEARALWTSFRDGPKMIDMPLADRRAAGEHAEDATSEPAGVTFASIEKRGILATPPDCRDDVAMLYLFGGGYVLGSPASRRKTAGHLANHARCRVLDADYRLAPEQPFPAALDDARTGFDWLVDTGARPEQIVICGDSAGGGLALALTIALRDDGVRSGGYVGLSPWTDLTCSGASMLDNAGVDVECSRDSLLEMARQYLAGHDPRDPLASAVFADMTGLPPMLVLVGGDEVLLDDATRVCRAQGRAGGDASLDIVGGGQHVFPIWAGVIPEADAALRRIGSWVIEKVGAS